VRDIVAENTKVDGKAAAELAVLVLHATPRFRKRCAEPD
jgi:hypothetical protein